MALALFDLDHTLLSGDSEWLWVEFLIARGVLDAALATRNAELARDYQAGLATPQAFCAFFAATLAGRSPAEWMPLRDAFMDEVVRPRIPDAARGLLLQHRRCGDVLVLTSASSRFLVEATAADLGFEHLIATELAQGADGRFAGRTQGTLNMGEGKVTRLRDWLAGRCTSPPDEVLAQAAFYSDSINDLPLLRAVGRPVAVDPDPRLAQEAQARQWPVLRLPRDAFAETS